MATNQPTAGSRWVPIDSEQPAPAKAESGGGDDEYAKFVAQNRIQPAAAPVPKPPTDRLSLGDFAQKAYDSTMGLALDAGQAIGEMVRPTPQPSFEDQVAQAAASQGPTSPAPVDPKAFADIKSTLGAMPREQRMLATNLPGWKGQAARVAVEQLDQEQQGIDRLKMGGMSPTIEGRTAHFAGQGASPEVAKSMATGEMTSGAVSEPVRFLKDGGQMAEADAAARQEGRDVQDRSLGVRAGFAALEGMKAGTQGVAAAALRAAGDDDTAKALELSARRSKIKIDSANELTAMRAHAQEVGTVYGNDAFWENQAVGGLASAAQNAPQIVAGMALTAVTKNPVAGARLSMGLMTSQSFGDQYIEGRMKQMTPGQAAARAGIMAGFEYLGERWGMVPQAMKAVRGKASEIPLDELPHFLERFVGALEKRGVLGSTAANVARGQLGEQFGEQLTTAGQYWVDGTPLGTDQPVSLSGYLEAARDTAIQTVIATGALEGAGAGVHKMAGGHTEASPNAGSYEANKAQAQAEGKWRDAFGAPGAGSPLVKPLQPAQGPTTPAASGQAAAVPAVRQDGGAPGVQSLEQGSLVRDAGGTPSAVDTAAHEAATSPTNDLPEPTQAQKEAGNYKVGRTRIGGMDIRIENPEGSVRKGMDANGTPWETQMRHHYGYFAGTMAADGDKLDVFVKPGLAEDWSGPVFVIDQVDPETGKLDEHKVVMGADDEAEAEQIYRSNYADDWQGLGAITKLPMPAFKAWANSGRLKDPLGDISHVQPSPAPPPKPAAPTKPASVTGFTEAFDSLAGGGISEDFMSKALDALRQGKSRISGVRDSILTRAKDAFDAGLINTTDDLRRFEAHGYPKVQQTPSGGVSGGTAGGSRQAPADPQASVQAQSSATTDSERTSILGMPIKGMPDWQLKRFASMSSAAPAVRAAASSELTRRESDQAAQKAVERAARQQQIADQVKGLQTGKLLRLANDTSRGSAALRKAAAEEVKRRETEAMWQQREAEQQAQEAEIVSEAQDQQVAQAIATSQAAETDAPTAMAAAFQAANEKKAKRDAVKARTASDPAAQPVESTQAPSDNSSTGEAAEPKATTAQADEPIQAKPDAETKVVRDKPVRKPKMGKEVSRDAGQFKEGMSEFRANQVKAELTKKNPTISYAVEFDPDLKHGHVVVGRATVSSKKAEGAPTVSDLTGDTSFSVVDDVASGRNVVIDKAELDQIINRNLRNWRGIGASQVAAVETWRDLPEDVLQSAENMGLSLSKLEGVLHRGRVTLVRSAIKSAEQAERILFHEIYGHIGLKAALDGRAQATLAELWDKMNGLAGVAKMAKKHEAAPGVTVWKRLQPYIKGTEYASQADRRAVIMDELIGYLAQANDTSALTTFKGYLSDLKTAVINTLKRFGMASLAARLDRAGTELDVLALVRDARNSIVTGKTRAGNPFVLSVRGQALNPAFSEVENSKFSMRDDEPVTLPDAIIGENLGAITSHPDYQAAKAGDTAAAFRLASDMVTPAMVEKVRAAVGDSVMILPVVSEEQAGRNKIPRAAAEVLADRLGTTTVTDVVQASRVYRTQLDGLGRLFASPEFTGPVEKGARYLLVDDTLTQGGTFAALASHITQNGGQVAGVFALTGKQYSAKLALSPDLLSKVRETYSDVEPAFRAATGRGFDSLTESEARYLAKHNSPQSVRDRIAQEGRQAGERATQGNDQGQQKGLIEQSASFKKWFGDSKIVTPDGRPMVVYHGTTSDFSKFDADFIGEGNGNGDWGEGFYFTDKPDAASQYAKGDGGNVMPVYLSMQNPATNDVMMSREVQNALDDDMGFASVKDVLAKLGYDGVAFTHKGVGTEYVVFDATQIKSAVGNSGDFNGQDPDILFSAQDGFHLPEFGRTGKFIEAVQNRYNRWKQAIEAVRKQGGTVTEANDFYQAEERYWGIVGAQLDDFKDEVSQFVKSVKADGLELDDVALYAYAKHAAERNAAIAKINPSMPEGGSGMTDAQAQAIIDSAKQAGLDAQLERHAAELNKWSEGTRQVLLQNGLISKDEYAQWTGAYQHYVPLRGQLGDDGSRRGTGAGFDIRGKESFRAMGRRSQAGHIIEHILQDRARALTRAGKNEVLRRFARFVLDNPDKTLWEVDATVKRRGIVQTPTGEQVTETEGINKDVANTVALKDGGQTIYITVKDDTLLKQLKNLHDEAKLPVVVESLHWANRLLSRMYTSLNPVFTVLNGMRDASSGAMNMVGVAGFKGAASMLGNLPAAYREAFRAEVNGIPSQAYEEYRRSGGKTGFMDFKDIEGYAQELSEMSQETQSWAQAVNTPGAAAKAKASWRKARGAVRKVLDRVEDVNGAVENATRFATFKAARDAGKSVAESANIAKNITINFNRRGSMTPVLSSWFLFFNPAVQGSARMVEALRSRQVQGAMGAAMVGMFGLALANAAAGGDDDDDGMTYWDKIPDEVKERNLVIMLPPGSSAGEKVPGSEYGRYLKIPMPYGYNSFAVLAQTLADILRNQGNPVHGVSAAKGAARIFKSFVGSWIPVSDVAPSFDNPKAVAMIGVPDALDPIVESVMNINSFGKQLYPEGSTQDKLPDSEKVFGAQRHTWKHNAARWLNEATGGSQYHEGMISITPATIDNLVRGYGGGVASFITSLADTVVTQGVVRDQVEWWRSPFVKQLYGEVNSMQDQAIAYDRLQNIEQAAEPLKRAVRAGDRQAAKAIVDDFGAVAKLGPVAEHARDRLTMIRKNEIRVIDSMTLTSAEKNMSLRQWDRERQKVYDSVNRAWAKSIQDQPTQ